MRQFGPNLTLAGVVDSCIAGIIGEDDDDLGGDVPRAGAVRWLDRLRNRTVRR